MLIGGVAVGLLLGLLAGGRLDNLAGIRLRYLPLLFLGVIVRFGTELGLSYGIPAVETLRLPLLGLAYGLLLFTLWQNRGYPGLALAFVGIAMNAIAIVANAGYMPVWDRAYAEAGLTGPINSSLHYVLSADDPAFLLRLGLLGDIIPIPVPPVQNVASIGDIFLTAGLAFFLFATLLRRPEPEKVETPDEPFANASVAVAGGRRVYLGGSQTASGGIAIQPGTGLASGLEEAAALERPLMLGARGVGMAQPALTPRPAEGPAPAAGAIVLPRPRLPERFREHPYVRLALNPSFSALWTGQVISLFGDRVNQIALAAFVYEATNSPFAVALTFFAGTVPNLILSPIAGAYVDRWEHKQVLVVSDILRAAAVLLLPVAVLLNVWLAYPLVFLITTISIFFRPARQAILPRVVPEDDLLPANSAMWVGETLADVINYPLAGLFVVFLQSSLAVAFWFDAVTYIASAVLISTIVVPPLIRKLVAEETRTTVVSDLREGWAFLRHETVLLANTLQGTAGQFAFGVLTVGSLILAREITPGGGDQYRATYAFMETAIGVGGLIGGFVLGAVAAKARKGLMIIVAYSLFGVGAMLLGLATSVPMVLVISAAMGVANMAFVIPSQTLFQERTPGELMGRVVSFRFALVFGGMSVAMAIGGLLIGQYGTGPVFVAAGLVSVAAGLSGLLVREVREA
jgi:DHA3 family macrolide efflux protein-like MFS transporter